MKENGKCCGNCGCRRKGWVGSLIWAIAVVIIVFLTSSCTIQRPIVYEISQDGKDTIQVETRYVDRPVYINGAGLGLGLLNPYYYGLNNQYYGNRYYNNRPIIINKRRRYGTNRNNVNIRRSRSRSRGNAPVRVRPSTSKNRRGTATRTQGKTRVRTQGRSTQTRPSQRKRRN